MKIYANRRRGTVDNLVGKAIWVLAQIGPSLMYVKILQANDSNVVYHYIPEVIIRDVASKDKPDFVISSYADTLRRIFKRAPSKYVVRRDSIRLMKDALTTEDILDLIEGIQ